MLSLIKRICQQLETIISLLEKSTHEQSPSLLKQVDEPAKIDDHLFQLPELLDIQQVVAILNISTATYYRWVRQGELIPRRKGKRHYYYQEDLQRQLEESKRRGRIYVPS